MMRSTRRLTTPCAARLAALAVLLALAPSAARAAPEGSPWGRDYFPDVTLVTHEGKSVKLYDDLILNKLVVFSFIYTRCTKQCPLITANLARVQRQVGDRLGKDIFFYSVSLDPKRDTPAVLKAYAQAFRVKPGWTFLTGAKEDIEKVRKKFGDLEEIESHSSNLIIGNDATGQWFATGAIDNPGYLAHVISDWLDPSWDKRPLKNSYANVPRVKPDQGADVFRQKCAMCHTGQDETVGASLEGITSRRDPAWLLRWLHAPERMLADQDPIAVALVARSNGRLLMPNQGLSEEEARAVIEYLGRPPVRTAAAP